MIEPCASLGRPRRFSVGVYFAFETLNQLARECGSLFVRESKSFYHELLGVHTGHYGPFTEGGTWSLTLATATTHATTNASARTVSAEAVQTTIATGTTGGNPRSHRATATTRRAISAEALAIQGNSNGDNHGNDPRDDARWPDRERGHVPRDVFTRDLDLPRGREREIVRVRDREYALRGSESRTLATVGAFRVVSSRDLRDHHDRPADPRSSDLRHLREQRLVETTRVPGSRDLAVSLTKEGRSLLESYRDRDRDGSQTFYAGVKRERELEHDVHVYRAFEREAERLEERGARIDRVILDYELKRDYQKWLHEHDRDRDNYDGHPDRDPHEIEEWAREHDLPYFDERVHFPDARIAPDLIGAMQTRSSCRLCQWRARRTA